MGMERESRVREVGRKILEIGIRGGRENAVVSCKGGVAERKVEHKSGEESMGI